ncbi:MAG: isoprenoid biosynthesis glyoxalase ElbB [Bradymonadia bacterium]
MKKVGVVLAGCGYLDGAEIQEAVATLLALEKRGFEVVAMAPNIPQMHVVDHRTQDVAEYTRNVLNESSRITRGEILELSEVDVSSLDAVVFPGGFGAAKNLCDFAVSGSEMTVNADVRTLIHQVYESGKPMGFICIAPVLAAAVLGRTATALELTIGDDAGTASAIEALGARHVVTGPGEIHVDVSNRIVSTPAYMLGPNIVRVFEGIDACIGALTEMI